MGDQIRGAAGDNNQNVAQGKNIQQVSVYADSITWREAVRESHDELRTEIRELRGWLRGLMITLLIFFIMGAVLTAFTIRQFDISNNWIQYNSRRIDQIERRQEWRIPGSSIPPGGTP